MRKKKFRGQTNESGGNENSQHSTGIDHVSCQITMKKLVFSFFFFKYSEKNADEAEEDDDDDDDSDDGDLEKYNLLDEDDVADIVSAKKYVFL